MLYAFASFCENSTKLFFRSEGTRFRGYVAIEYIQGDPESKPTSFVKILSNDWPIFIQFFYCHTEQKDEDTTISQMRQ